MSPMNQCLWYLVLLTFFVFAACLTEKLTPLLPGDPYKVSGEIETRRLGRCNYSYAWLAIPTGSHQDIYAHAAACNRLELRSNEAESSFYAFPRDTRSFTAGDQDYSRATVEDELKRVNKEHASQLVDLATLDALLVAVKVEEGVQSNPALAKDDRLFYLADRLGQYKMLAMLRPGRDPKIEIIPPPSQKSYFYPRFVLCYRKMCLEPPVIPSSETLKGTKSDGIQSNNNISAETAQAYIDELSKSKQENRRLYIQLIIYRIVFALTAFLCLLFGIAALILCFRLRKVHQLPKKRQIAENRSSCNPTPIPRFYTNSKIIYPANSPLVYADQSGSMNIGHIHSDTASLHNTALSSNLSNCELMAASGVSATAYPAPFAYSYSSDFPVNVIPVRQVISGGQNSFVRSTSPASSSMQMEGTPGFRSNSFDNQSEKRRLRNSVQLVPQTSVSQFTTLEPYPQCAQNFKVINPSSDHTMDSQGSMNTVVHRFASVNGYDTHANQNGLK